MNSHTHQLKLCYDFTVKFLVLIGSIDWPSVVPIVIIVSNDVNIVSKQRGLNLDENWENRDYV